MNDLWGTTQEWFKFTERAARDPILIAQRDNPSKQKIGERSHYLAASSSIKESRKKLTRKLFQKWPLNGMKEQKYWLNFWIWMYMPLHMHHRKQHKDQNESTYSLAMKHVHLRSCRPRRDPKHPTAALNVQLLITADIQNKCSRSFLECLAFSPFFLPSSCFLCWKKKKKSDADIWVCTHISLPLPHVH